MYILLALLLFIALLCLLRIRIEIIANDSVEAYAKVLWIKIPLYPQKEKHVSARKFKRGYPKAKKESPPVKKEKATKESADKKIPLGDTISTVLGLVKLLFSRFFKHLRLDISKIVVTIGAEDAAKCAIQYGIIAQSVAYLLSFLDKNLHISKKRNGVIDVRCDFTSEQIVYDIHIAASLTVWQILDIGITLAYNYFKGKDIFHLIKS